MALDKWIAIFFLVFSLVYGYASYTYPLLPFERNMVFLPNTMPMALSVLGILISGGLLFASAKSPAEQETSSQGLTMSRLLDYKLGQALAILAAMVIYALLLRPLGFIPATILFLVGCSWVLGERKYWIMASVSTLSAVGIWYLVQEILGIFLKPLPAFLS